MEQHVTRTAAAADTDFRLSTARQRDLYRAGSQDGWIVHGPMIGHHLNRFKSGVGGGMVPSKLEMTPGVLIKSVGIESGAFSADVR
jgi:hypothetical protein